jgi:hypothetical protein
MVGILTLKNNYYFIILLLNYKMRYLFTSEKDRLLKTILSQSNTNIESITLENFEDMTEDDLRSIILIGNGRIRHAYRPESLYSQYVARRGIVRDPQNPSYTLSQDDLNNVFNQMRQRYPDFQPEIFNEERSTTENVKRLLDDDDNNDNPLNSQENDNNEYIRNTQSRGNHLGSQRPHSLLSGRNSYLDELEREFNDMVNRPSHYTKEKRPYEYSNDKGKGPGGFPMRSGSNGDIGMPAKEPLFEPHRILLYDPDNRHTPTKNQIHTLAYTYQFSPYRNAIIEAFSPGNNKGDNITSEKMPEWMTVDPMKRDKVTFLEDNYRKDSYLQNSKQPVKKESTEARKTQIRVNKDKPKVWWLVIALILFILLKKL